MTHKVTLAKCDRKMNHILKKLQIAGAKKQEKPEPPVYNPPKMGELQYGASHSYAETLDLISEGPIAGVVNSQGDLMDGLNVLQGVYLDDTAVAIEADNSTLTRLEAENMSEYSMGLANTNDTGIKSLINFCKALQQQTQDMVTALDFQGSEGVVSWVESEGTPHNQVNLLLIAFRRNNRHWLTTDPLGLLDAALYIRAFIKYTAPDPLDSQTFHMWLDGNQLSGQDIGDGEIPFSATNASYRDVAYPVGQRKPWEYRLGTGLNGPRSLFWTDGTTLGTSKFFTSYSPMLGQDSSFWGLFSEGLDYAQEFVQPELDAILELYNNSREGGAGERNPYQETLARRALENMGWTPDKNITTLLKDPLPYYNVLMIAKISEEDNASLNRSVLNDEGQVSSMGAMPYSTETSHVPMGNGGDFYTNYGTYHQLSTNADEWFSSPTSSDSKSVKDVSCPEVDAEGNLTGKMHGFIMYTFRPSMQYHRYSGDKTLYVYESAWPEAVVAELARIHSLRYTKQALAWGALHDSLESGDTELQSGGLLTSLRTSSFLSQRKNNLKFNYSNVLAEIKRGEEFQEPLTNFRKIFIDHIYSAALIGPFRTERASDPLMWPIDLQEQAGSQSFAPQRISQNQYLLTRNRVLTEDSENFNLDMADGLPLHEGSDDRRKSGNEDVKNYSSWGKNSLAHWDEKAIPVVHTVYNPNVTSVFITLNVQSLNDTLINNVDDVFHAGDDGDADDMDINTKFPTVLNIEVETGTIGRRKNETGTNEKTFESHTFRIVALIEGQTLIDIGNPDNEKTRGNKDYVISVGSADTRTSLNVPFKLPLINQGEVRGVNENTTIVGNADQEQPENRYVKVTKLSFESNSILISKVVNLYKVTEIIESNLHYPFSAIVGTKLDSRSFSSVPQRSYDCKLKLVRIPNNYFPDDINGKDKRYYKSTEEFDDASKSRKLIYEGDWDGRFHTKLMWTDNPAWILYDILTNNRYGMGSHIDEDKINKWQLYKIGRFCDAVDDNGYFEGVTDGHGGLEPRFSCNVVFQQGQKLYDAINTIAGLFRGRVFFGNSEINFVDDRPRRTTNLFTNESVKDGQFFYSNNRRDQQFNTIEVSFKDRFDNFVPKLEVVEDEEDLRERGIFKTRIEGVGITSRAMANRVGQHRIFSSIDENQTVAFTAGLESLLCQPGDLINIEDELKTNKANFGKVLAVDLEAETIRLSNTFVEKDMTGRLTVYNPTGRDTIEDIDEINWIKRYRYEGFTITGFEASPPTPPPWVRYTGDYQFSGYTTGYNVEQGPESDLYQQYGLYTGVSGTFLYFQTEATGWTFASGTGEGNAGAFDLGSGDFIAELTGAQSLNQFNTGKLSPWVEGGDHRGGSPTPFSGFSGFGKAYDGVLNSEISAVSPDQMNVLSVTGEILIKDYGSVLSGFDKPQLLPFVKLGSPAKFELIDASPFIYKVISMKEDAPNEYLVTATKYDTGKYNLIEKNISIENKANTYSYQVAQTINGIKYSTLDSPVLDLLTTGEPDVTNDTFSITGTWTGVSESTGYNVRLTQPNGTVIEDSIAASIADPNTGYIFEGLSQVGVFNFCVNALGNKGGDGNVNAFFDSPYDCSGMFVVYDELLLFNSAFVNTVEIMEI